jgi:hypothetical protein
MGESMFQTYDTEVEISDLKANRAGQLSQSQIKRLKKLPFEKVPTYLFLSGLGLLFYAAIVVDALQKNVNNSGTTTFIVATLAYMIVPAIFFIAFMKRLNLSRKDLEPGSVAVVSGEAIILKRTVRNKRSTRLEYSLKIGDVTFDASPDILNVVASGDSYRLYYAPHTKTMLTIENLSQPHAKSKKRRPMRTKRPMQRDI